MHLDDERLHHKEGDEEEDGEEEQEEEDEEEEEEPRESIYPGRRHGSVYLRGGGAPDT